MKSPFPGMDPWLERSWGDIHHRLIQYSCDLLQGRLPGDLRARVEERVFVELPEPVRPPRYMVPDVVLLERGRPAQGGGGGVLAAPPVRPVSQPMVFHMTHDPITESWIEIRDRSGNTVVTVIEFLSPANKSGGVGQELYLKKQREVLSSMANLVEVDLVRTGERVLALPTLQIPVSVWDDYLTCVSVAWDDRRIDLYPMPLREPLPVINIPLRREDAPVPLDLQELIEQAYTAGRYDDTDYSLPPSSALSAEDAAWAADLVNAARRG